MVETRLTKFLRYAICSEEAMASIYRAKYVSLHVRKSNRAAIGLYRDSLGFDVHEVTKSYCELRCVADTTDDNHDLFSQMQTGRMHLLCD